MRAWTRPRTFLRPLGPKRRGDDGGNSNDGSGDPRCASNASVGAASLAFERQAEMRFHGQRHTVRTAVDAPASAEAIRSRFEQNYERRYGFVERDAPIEPVSLVLTAVATMQRPRPASLAQPALSGAEPTKRPVFFAERGERLETPVYQRSALPTGFAARGPAVIEEYGSTTVVGPRIDSKSVASAKSV